MGFASLVSDIKSSLDYQATSDDTSNLTTHAEKFASAVDNYATSLIDPAKRSPISGGPILISSILIASILIPNLPGDAEIPSIVYATAISGYVAALQIPSTPIMLTIGGIKVPPGVPAVAKLNDLGVFPSIKGDFKNIFTEESPEGIPQQVLLLLKANKIANAIKKALIDKTSVLISGMDSLVPVPTPFSISGPLEEV